MFVRHIKDNDDMLQHLFWCHGESQLNFEIFGDMIGFGFDATYRNNKYLYPFIIFSSINKHKNYHFSHCSCVSRNSENIYLIVKSNFLKQ